MIQNKFHLHELLHSPKNHRPITKQLSWQYTKSGHKPKDRFSTKSDWLTLAQSLWHWTRFIHLQDGHSSIYWNTGKCSFLFTASSWRPTQTSTSRTSNTDVMGVQFLQTMIQFLQHSSRMQAFVLFLSHTHTHTHTLLVNIYLSILILLVKSHQ